MITRITKEFAPLRLPQRVWWWRGVHCLYNATRNVHKVNVSALPAIHTRVGHNISGTFSIRHGLDTLGDHTMILEAYRCNVQPQWRSWKFINARSGLDNIPGSFWKQHYDVRFGLTNVPRRWQKQVSASTMAHEAHRRKIQPQQCSWKFINIKFSLGNSPEIYKRTV